MCDDVDVYGVVWWCWYDVDDVVDCCWCWLVLMMVLIGVDDRWCGVDVDVDVIQSDWLVLIDGDWLLIDWCWLLMLMMVWSPLIRWSLFCGDVMVSMSMLMFDVDRDVDVDVDVWCGWVINRHQSSSSACSVVWW